MTKTQYRALHFWVQKRLGKAFFCSNDSNHKSIVYDWANLSGEYKKDISDFKSLCRSCHRKMDKSKPPTFLGRKHTEETKRKISEAHKTENISDEYRQKMSAWQKGKSKSLKTKQKISQTMKGKYYCKEHKKLCLVKRMRALKSHHEN